MIEVVKKGRGTRVLFVCPICKCEFLADLEDYNHFATPMTIKKRSVVYRVAYSCKCPNCNYKVEKIEMIEEVKRE